MLLVREKVQESTTPPAQLEGKGAASETSSISSNDAGDKRGGSVSRPNMAVSSMANETERQLACKVSLMLINLSII